MRTGALSRVLDQHCLLFCECQPEAVVTEELLGSLLRTPAQVGRILPLLPQQQSQTKGIWDLIEKQRQDKKWGCWTAAWISLWDNIMNLVRFTRSETGSVKWGNCAFQMLGGSYKNHKILKQNLSCTAKILVPLKISQFFGSRRKSSSY